MDAGNDIEQWRRLQTAYADLADAELLRLAGQRDGLTEVAQNVLDGEMQRRGLHVETDDAISNRDNVTLAAAADDPNKVMLWYFPVAAEAWAAGRLLEGAGIEFRVEQAWDGPDGGHVLSEELEREKTARYADKSWNADRRTLPGVSIYIDRSRQQDAVALLRNNLGLFPEREVDGRAPDADEEESDLFPLGEFATEAEFGAAKTALQSSGIWFHSAEVTGSHSIQVRFEDLDCAVDAVDGALSE